MGIAVCTYVCTKYMHTYCTVTREYRIDFRVMLLSLRGKYLMTKVFEVLVFGKKAKTCLTFIELEKDMGNPKQVKFPLHI